MRSATAVPHGPSSVVCAISHLRSGDNDVIITIGPQWQTAQEDLRVCHEPVNGRDDPNPMAARRLHAMSEQPVASKLSSSRRRHVLQLCKAKS